MHIVELKVRATSLSTQDIVVLRPFLYLADDVLHSHAGDDDAVGGLTSWTAIEVVLLNVNAVVGDVVENDVLVGDTVRLC